MARDGGSCNFNQRGSSTPFTEHGLCRQMESHNGGTIAPQRSTERASIFSATNGTTRGERSQQPFQTTCAKNVDPGVISREFSKYVSSTDEARAEGAALSAPVGQREIFGHASFE